jgi:hypothetical protein
MIKRLFFLSMIASAAGVPYVLSTGSQWLGALSSKVTSSDKESPGPGGASLGAGANFSAAPLSASLDRGGPPAAGAAARLPPEGYATSDLAEVLHFDGSPAWVMSRWPRVTTGLSDVDLQGYRVPLVTGTAEDDLAGSLTYYFDREQRVKFIHFRGTTGNPHKLIALVTARYGFLQQPTNDPALLVYQVKWNGKPYSELRVRPARILRASQPRTRYEVELAMKKP